jgi:hypothetical protein
VPLEVLNGSFVLLGSFTRPECSKIFSFAGLWMLLSGIQAVFTRFEFSDHRDSPQLI